MLNRHRYAPVAWLIVIALSVFTLTRLLLLFSFYNDIRPSLGSFFTALLTGFGYDLITVFFVVLPLALHITFTSEWIYSRYGRWVMIVLFAAGLFVIFFTGLIPKEFNKHLPLIFGSYILLRLLIFLLLLYKGHTFRLRWRATVLQVWLLIFVFLLLFNAVSEWFFWAEFYGRYNFIAVDYLVYTHEVIGNIRESYPVGWLIAITALVAGAITWLLRSAYRGSVTMPATWRTHIVAALILFGLPALSVIAGDPGWKNISKDNYTQELGANGFYEFVRAFEQNELDFYRYYETMPDKEAVKLVRDKLTTPYTTWSPDPMSLERTIQYPGAEQKMNVVLISVESLSADFMGSFGNDKGLTPGLDSLAARGILFRGMYASGTRTVRGLESLSLALPPTPGQSIVKRPGNENLFSLGSIFRSKGYITQYLYGGYGYFDNMNYFFSHNDYEVIDRSALRNDEIHYANIWGVADEDLFTLALRTFDQNYTAGKPFFSHVMTVSNHRPYTYPEGRIDIPPTAHSRDGAVKYTDYAIGDFIRRASSHPWFKNTLFVIVADHCASSAGKSALPPKGYHIPLIFFAPGHIAPTVDDKLMAQIDIAPSILGFLNFDYKSRFFGQDIFHLPENAERRAFISTYQGLGFLRDSLLVVQSPVKKIQVFRPDFKSSQAQEVPRVDSLVREAMAFYQTAAWVIREGKYKIR